MVDFRRKSFANPLSRTSFAERFFIPLLLAVMLCALGDIGNALANSPTGEGPIMGSRASSSEAAELAKLSDNKPFFIHGFYWVPSADTAPVYIHYDENISFVIPRNYLVHLGKNAYGTEIWFAILSPDMTGMIPRELPNYIHFTGYERNPNIVTVKGIFTDVTTKTNALIFGRENIRENHEMLYGLMKANHNPVAFMDDTYFTEDDPEIGNVAIGCFKPERAEGLSSCKGIINVSNNISFIYEYNRVLLPKWREIHKAVLNLFNSTVRQEN